MLKYMHTKPPTAITAHRTCRASLSVVKLWQGDRKSNQSLWSGLHYTVPKPTHGGLHWPSFLAQHCAQRHETLAGAPRELLLQYCATLSTFFFIFLLFFLAQIGVNLQTQACDWLTDNNLDVSPSK